MAGNADVKPGDLLTTSGVDGVYPPGLPVARVEKVERRADSGFARITCSPQALVDGARHVMVLKAGAANVPARPDDAAAAAEEGRQEVMPPRSSLRVVAAAQGASASLRRLVGG